MSRKVVVEGLVKDFEKKRRMDLKRGGPSVKKRACKQAGSSWPPIPEAPVRAHGACLVLSPSSWIHANFQDSPGSREEERGGVAIETAP